MATSKKGPLAAHCVLLNKKGGKIQKRAAAREKIVDVMIALARKEHFSNTKVLAYKNALHMAATSGAIALETATRDKTMSLTEALKLLKNSTCRNGSRKIKFLSAPPNRNSTPPHI